MSWRKEDISLCRFNVNKNESPSNFVVCYSNYGIIVMLLFACPQLFCCVLYSFSTSFTPDLEYLHKSNGSVFLHNVANNEVLEFLPGDKFVSHSLYILPLVLLFALEPPSLPHQTVTKIKTKTEFIQLWWVWVVIFGTITFILQHSVNPLTSLSCNFFKLPLDVLLQAFWRLFFGCWLPLVLLSVKMIRDCFKNVEVGTGKLLLRLL